MGFGKEVVSLGLQRTGNWVLAWGVTSCVYDESKSMGETVRERMDKMNLKFLGKRMQQLAGKINPDCTDKPSPGVWVKRIDISWVKVYSGVDDRSSDIS